MREWAARALELQTLEQEARQAQAQQANMVYYNCSEMVATRLGLKKDADRIAIRKALKKMLNPLAF